MRGLKAIEWRRKDKVRYYKVECTGWDRMTEVKEQEGVKENAQGSGLMRVVGGGFVSQFRGYIGRKE